MPRSAPRARMFRVLAALALAGGLLSVAAGASAAVACPSVDPGTGAVSPAPVPGVDWSGCVLNGANLSGADLAGANLSHALVQVANLTGATLTNVDLNGAWLNGDNVAGADLSGTGTVLTGVHSGKVSGTPAALPQNWHLLGGYLLGPGAYLASADLASAALTGFDLAGADLTRANLAGADLSGAGLTNANLTTARLAGTDIAGADLTGATMNGVSSGSVTGSPATILPQHWSLHGGYLMGPVADLSGADLSNLDLSGVDLEYAALPGANLSGTLLAQTDITGIRSGGVTGSPPPTLPVNWQIAGGYLAGPGADLDSAVLSNLDLAHADLAGATLSWSNLSATDLSGADLGNAALGSADLTGTDLTGANLSGASLGNATLHSAKLGTDDLTATDLTSVWSQNVLGTPALPAHWTLIEGYLIGPTANLQQASLAGVNLAGADLTHISLGGADLSSASLAGANLTQAWLAGAKLTSADLGGADLTEANLQSADLANASLAHANLTSAVLTLVNMPGTDFTAASLANILFYGAGTGTPAALPAPWKAVDGYLIGPTVGIYGGADLRNADLSGDDLAGAGLDNADLTGANLDDVNLTGASLGNATMTGASLTGVIWLHTTCPDYSSSDKHLAGCFSPLDTTPPVVTVTGAGNRHTYVIGAVPRPGCRTADDGAVAKPAVLTVTTTGSQGVGRFTATCAGAVDLAGNGQQAAVRATYTVLYGMPGFLAPLPGSTIARSSHVISVRFRLTDASGTPIASKRAAALAAAGDVRATLLGPHISAVTSACGWDGTHRRFACRIQIPAGVRTGSSWRYTITAKENAGTGSVPVPGVGGAADPEVVHFR